MTAAGTKPPAASGRREPGAEALDAFGRLEGFLRDGRGRPFGDGADETLRRLARARLEGKRAWHHAAEDLPDALPAEPPAYVPVRDSEAFAGAVDDLLDRLHEITFTGRSAARTRA